MKEISSLQEIAEDDYFIFKHSATCPISSRAHDTVAASEGNIDLPIYIVVIQNNRPLSNEIEQQLGVRHETPQLILVRDGKAEWYASHFRITAKAIINAVNGG